MKIPYMTIACGFLVSVSSLAATPGFGTRITGKETPLLVEYLGVGDKHILTNGFIFVDSEYISAPYTVQRIGQGVVVNGILVNQLYQGRLPWTNSVETSTELKDPSMPTGITETNRISDAHVRAYLNQKKKYIYSNVSTNDPGTMLIKAIKALPCVEGVEDFAPGSITVRHKNGERIGFELSLHHFATPLLQRGPEEMLRAINSQVDMLTTNLHWNMAVFLSEGSPYTNSAMLSLLQIWPPQHLRTAIDAVQATDPQEANIQKLEPTLRWRHGKHSAKQIADFVKNVGKAPQLIERLQSTGKENAPVSP